MESLRTFRHGDDGVELRSTIVPFGEWEWPVGEYEERMRGYYDKVKSLGG